LIHEVGIVIFDDLPPEKHTWFLEQIKSSDLTLYENEERTFGITHAELDVQFIEKWWAFSLGLVEPIRTNHDSPR
jgi:hypothetical protein